MCRGPEHGHVDADLHEERLCPTSSRGTFGLTKTVGHHLLDALADTIVLLVEAFERTKMKVEYESVVVTHVPIQAPLRCRTRCGAAVAAARGSGPQELGTLYGVAGHTLQQSIVVADALAVSAELDLAVH